MDLSDLASVRASAEALQGLDRIDMIILNAGVMVRLITTRCAAQNASFRGICTSLGKFD